MAVALYGPTVTTFYNLIFQMIIMLSTGTTLHQAGWDRRTEFLLLPVSPQWLQGIFFCLVDNGGVLVVEVDIWLLLLLVAFCGCCPLFLWEYW